MNRPTVCLSNRIYHTILTWRGAEGPGAPHLNTFPDYVNPWGRAKPPTPCEARESRRLVPRSWKRNIE